MIGSLEIEGNAFLTSYDGVTLDTPTDMRRCEVICCSAIASSLLRPFTQPKALWSTAYSSILCTLAHTAIKMHLITTANEWMIRVSSAYVWGEMCETSFLGIWCPKERVAMIRGEDVMNKDLVKRRNQW